MTTTIEETPREQFLKAQRQIAEDNMKANGLPDVSEEEVDAVEHEIDKSMGEEKFVVTSEEFHEKKSAKEQAETINRLKQQINKGKHLDNKQRALLNAVMRNAEGVADPVLKHLIKQRVIQQQKLEATGKQVSELNKKIMEELTTASQELLKVQGVVEHADQQILDYVENNPDSIVS